MERQPTQGDAELSDRDFTIRRTTKLELGLAVGLLVNAIGIAVFATTIVGRVSAVTDSVKEAIVEIRAMRAQAPDLAVLKYRVEQLEQKTRR